MANTITADEIREQFSQAMSAMYQQEVRNMARCWNLSLM